MSALNYSEEHTMFRETFRKFVAREITPFVPQWEEERAVPREIWKKMGAQGFLCPWLPERYGGLGLGFEYSVIINEELIRGDAFGVADGTNLTVMQLLLATDSLTDMPDSEEGFAHIYDTDGNGLIDAEEADLRAQANLIYTSINEGG